MTSTFGWLDTSAEQRRQAQEIIALFTDKEGRDELGIGTIRDAISDLLFPGTSMLLTRARYCLFVPWAYLHPRARRKTGQDHLDTAMSIERELIGTLIEEEPDSGAGVIGRYAGAAVQNLPSTLYWVALTQYGIVRRPSRNLLGLSGATTDAPNELADRADLDWHPDIPPAPGGFPRQTGSGFDLSHVEASWLRDRMLLTCPGTPLSDLLTPGIIDETAIFELQASQFPWDIPRLKAHPSVIQAELFSTTIHGAVLLYNLLVAERCEDEGLTTFDGHTDRYRTALVDWADRIHRNAIRQHWDIETFWATVGGQGSFVSRPATRAFVDEWVETVVADGPDGVADHQGLRRLVRRQEERKGKQSRLLNERMLPTWSGASAAGQLTFRWSYVARIVSDIFEGMMRDARA